MGEGVGVGRGEWLAKSGGTGALLTRRSVCGERDKAQ